MSTKHLTPNGIVIPHGLTRQEAETRLRQYGPNAVREAKPHLFLAIAKKFWAPVPWMLEVTIILELILGKRPEAIIIGFLLVFNAGLGFVQENKAQNALALLRKRLPVKARVLREGQWQLLAAEDLVPGDFNPHSQVNLCLSKRGLVELHLLDRWSSAGKQVAKLSPRAPAPTLARRPS
jgi:magnesium-transporting ATPase (P-type)